MCPKLEWIYPADARRYLGDQLLPEDDGLVDFLCWKLLKRTFLPDPPIILQGSANGVTVVDGIHRLSAITHSGLPEDVFVEWRTES